MPAAVTVFDQAGLDILLHRQLGQAFEINMRADISQRTTNQQRLFLPVFLKELFWGEPPSNVIGFMAVSRACEPFYGLQYVQAAVPHHSLQERNFCAPCPVKIFHFIPDNF
jgi:hypothetical protein